MTEKQLDHHHHQQPISSSDDHKYHEFLRALYRVRYFLASPFKIRLLPSFVPVIPVPYLKEFSYVTVGQVLLIVSWLILFLAGYHKTFNTAELGGSGQIASYALVAAYLTANKANSFLSFFFGLSFERLIPIHNLYACLSVILSVFHLYVAFVYGGSSGDSAESNDDVGSDDDRRVLGTERRLSNDSDYSIPGPDSNLWKFLWDGNTNFTGSMCTACMVGLVLTSFFRIIRKYLFEPWLFSHIIFSVGVLAFGLMHNVPLLAVPLAWWLLDIALRYGLHACHRFPHTATLTKLADDLIEVRFKRTFSYKPGQFVQINIPAIGPTQFHPITISSAPFDKEVTLHVRTLGGWSKALAALAGRSSETNILVEGPYGDMSFDITDGTKYPVVLCISGGIGVTPCQSVARQLLHDADHGRPLTHLRFTWTIRGTKMMDELPTVVTDDVNHIFLEDDAEVSSDPTKAPKFLPEIYVTKASENDLQGRQIARKGRPDISQIIEDTIAVAKANGHDAVAVITCGPERMVDEVKAACRKRTGLCGGVAIEVHDEIFDF